MASSDKSLAGKVALVTGATSGLGLRIFRELARRGAKVYATGRNEETGRKVAAEFPDNAVFVKVDLATAQGARTGAESILHHESGENGRLDILVNNAAALARQYELSPDDIVDTMGTNFIGHFVLVQVLLPLLKKTAALSDADVRIVTVGSGAYKWPTKETFEGVARGDFSNQYGSNSVAAQMKRYSMSKTAQMLWMRELAAQFKADGVHIKTISADPGGIYSEGARDNIKRQIPFPLSKIVDAGLYLFAAAPEKAAASTIWAVTSPDAKPDSCVERRGSRTVTSKWTALADDEQLRRELWVSAEKFVFEKLGQAPVSVARETESLPS